MFSKPMKEPELNYLVIFNDHFFEFIDDIVSVFPDDMDLKVAKNALLLVRKTNPKILIKIFKKYVVGKYKKEIEDGNIDFFINKNYNDDIEKLDNASKIMESINRLKEPISNMKVEDKDKVIKYIQNLTKLTDFYFENETN